MEPHTRNEQAHRQKKPSKPQDHPPPSPPSINEKKFPDPCPSHNWHRVTDIDFATAPRINAARYIRALQRPIIPFHPYDL